MSWLWCLIGWHDWVPTLTSVDRVERAEMCAACGGKRYTRIG